MKQINTKEKGFSLIEILVSAAVVASALVGLTMLLSYVIKSDSQANYRVVATQLAQEGIDFFRQERSILGWGGLSQVLTADDYCLNDTSEFSESVNNTVFASMSPAADCEFELLATESNLEYRRTAVIEENADSTIRVAVEVAWENDQGEANSVVSRIEFKSQAFGGGEFVPVEPEEEAVVCECGDPIPGCFFGSPQCVQHLDGSCEWECVDDGGDPEF